MEINKIHSIQIYINNEEIDILSQDELNLCFNNVFADPTKIQTTSAEYSFSFELPKTDKNNIILDFANVPSKRAKFNKQFPATVSVDGLVLFNGTLLIQSVDKNGYDCNLYINRLNTVETIFGDSLMGDITGWTMPYKQETTINEYNSNPDISYPQDVFFPLVSYGMFQKLPKSTSGTGSESISIYTSKHTLDDYCRFYNETFYPSLNVLKTIEKCFNHKGYDVTGDVFDDEVLRRVYSSVSLADGQDPEYNYGDPDMGKLTFDWSFSSTKGEISEKGLSNIATYVPFTVDDEYKITRTGSNGEFVDFDTVNQYDIWSQTSDFTTISNVSNRNLWRDNMIVVPSTGYYKIKMTYSFEIPTDFKPYPVYVYTNEFDGSRRGKVVETAYTPTASFEEYWTELQLVRNKLDTRCGFIAPSNFNNVDASAVGGTGLEVYGFGYSPFPHESPTVSITTPSRNGGTRAGGTSPADEGFVSYQPKSRFGTLQYDPRVDENFICGQSAMKVYFYNSVMKNGNSWDATCTSENKVRFNCDSYMGWKRTYVETGSRGGGYYQYSSGSTNYNKNTLTNGHISSTVSGNRKVTGTIETIMYLEKNDMIQLKLLQRNWTNKDYNDDEGGSTRGTSADRGSVSTDRRLSYLGAAGTSFMTDAKIVASGSILFEAYSPDDISIIDDSKFDMSGNTRYSADLDLSKFLNKEEKMADYVNNFIREFNLSYSQDGKTISLNTQKIDTKPDNYAVNLTDRLSDYDYTLEAIDYPSKMYVSYTIDEGERGFYTSAEKNGGLSAVQGNDWKEFADRGYDKIDLLDDEFGSEVNATTKTSYNWFEDFKLDYKSQTGTLSIPIIAKDEWMIDGYKDAEMMKKDGYGLKRRYWFPDRKTDKYLCLTNNDERKVYITLCRQTHNDCDMSYKNPDNVGTNDTLLSKYFNIFFNCDTNYMITETYLTTAEYLAIRNGANVIIDDDVYIVTKMDGYDCSGKNKTKITCIKK